jgi:hypothetical protein
VWDIRSLKTHVESNAQSGNIWQVKFDGSNVWSASEDCSVQRWDFTKQTKPLLYPQNMPVNSVDVVGGVMFAGGDAGMLAAHIL